jgi:hypothetical protein
VRREDAGRQPAHNVERLIAAHGADAKVTDLLRTLADCEKASSPLGRKRKSL